MALLKPLLSDGVQTRQVLPGDVIATGEIIPTTFTTTAPTITGAHLSRAFVNRSPAAPATDTLDTAANIVATIGVVLGTTVIPNGTAWRITWIVTTANALTVTATANTGVTVTRGAIAASSSKSFLFTVVNGTPAQVVSGQTVSASAVVSGFSAATLALLSPGMIVTNAVANLQGQTIIGIDIGAGTITFSGNANASGTNTINLSPVVLLEGIGAMLI